MMFGLLRRQATSLAEGGLLSCSAAAGRLGPGENGVLHLLDVDSLLAQPVEHGRQHAHAVVMPHDHALRGGRAAGEVDGADGMAGALEGLDDPYHFGGDGLGGLVGRGADVRACRSPARPVPCRSTRPRRRPVRPRNVQPDAEALVAMAARKAGYRPARRVRC